MNDRNMFEIAHSLKRQFGEKGIYRGMNLYSFADNHDVSRIASVLKDRVRRELPELRTGGYREALVSHDCLAFFRESGDGKVLAAVNASGKPIELSLPGFSPSGAYHDPLNGDEGIRVEDGKLRLTVYPRWGRLVKAG